MFYIALHRLRTFNLTSNFSKADGFLANVQNDRKRPFHRQQQQRNVIFYRAMVYTGLQDLLTHINLKACRQIFPTFKSVHGDLLIKVFKCNISTLKPMNVCFYRPVCLYLSVYLQHAMLRPIRLAVATAHLNKQGAQQPRRLGQTSHVVYSLFRSLC